MADVFEIANRIRVNAGMRNAEIESVNEQITYVNYDEEENGDFWWTIESRYGEIYAIYCNIVSRNRDNGKVIRVVKSHTVRDFDDDVYDLADYMSSEEFLQMMDEDFNRAYRRQFDK